MTYYKNCIFTELNKQYFFYSVTQKQQNKEARRKADYPLETYCKLIDGDRKEYTEMTDSNGFNMYYTLNSYIEAYMKRYPDGIFLGEGEITK
jgi:hypothetical protein